MQQARFAPQRSDVPPRPIGCRAAPAAAITCLQPRRATGKCCVPDALHRAGHELPAKVVSECKVWGRHEGPGSNPWCRKRAAAPAPAERSACVAIRASHASGRQRIHDRVYRPPSLARSWTYRQRPADDPPMRRWCGALRRARGRRWRLASVHQTQPNERVTLPVSVTTFGCSGPPLITLPGQWWQTTLTRHAAVVSRARLWRREHRVVHSPVVQPG